STQTRALRFASRRKRLQAAYIERVESNVRLHGGVDGSSQLHLIFNSGTAHAVAEVNDRFLLIDLGQRLGNRLNRLQLAIGIELVVLGVVGDERSTGVWCAFCGAGIACLESLPLI